MKTTQQWIVALLVIATVAVGGYKKYHPLHNPPRQQVQVAPPEQRPSEDLPKIPLIPKITTATPNYLPYPQVVQQLKQWNQEAPGLTEVNTYGKSAKGNDLYYIRIHNPKTTGEPVLITGCIHGNEPLAAATVMAYIGNMLSTYGKDDEVTKLIDTRDIYFVPVVSPDSYPNSRAIDGVDPNRDFPGPTRPNHKSTACPSAMQDLFMKIKPKAVISGHTFGQVYLYPYGDRYQLCPNDPDFKRIVGKMGQMSQYRMDRACNNYRTPITGTEVDWYYRNGAFSQTQNGKIHRGAFAIVCEFGTHQRTPTDQEIKTELNRTYAAFLYFLQEAPLVEIWWNEKGEPVNKNGTPKK